MKNIVYSLLCIFGLFSCRKDQSFEYIYPVNKKAVISDVSYGSDPKQTMDIFLPANRNASTKTIVFIHGGAWNKGDKSDFVDIPSLYADSGITALSVNYRLADSSKGIDYNVILSDIQNAILFAQSKTSVYGAAFDQVTLFGYSAGGHLALLYAYKIRKIEHVIALAAPTDLNDTDLLSAYDMRERVTNMIGSDEPYKRLLASPIFYNETVTTYLYHGKEDLNVPFQQSVVFYNKIEALNAKSRLVLFEHTGHIFSESSHKQIQMETIPLIKR